MFGQLFLFRKRQFFFRVLFQSNLACWTAQFFSPLLFGASYGLATLIKLPPPSSSLLPLEKKENKNSKGSHFDGLRCNLQLPVLQLGDRQKKEGGEGGGGDGGGGRRRRGEGRRPAFFPFLFWE